MVNGPQTQTTVVNNLKILIDGIKLFGVNEADFINQIGIAPIILQNPLNRIETATLLNAWKVAIEKTGDPGLGLKLGMYGHPSDYNILGQMMMHCKDLRSALYTSVKYEQLLTESTETKLEETNEHCIVTMTFNDAFSVESARPPIEKHFADFLSVCNYLTNHRHSDDIWLERINFKHKQAASVEAYQKAFNAPVFFEQPSNQIIVSHQVLALPVHAPDKDLLTTIIDKAKKRVSLQEVDESFSCDVLCYLKENLNKGFPSSVEAAEHFNVSQSTFKRKLKADGWSYQKLCDQLRKDTADHLLRETQYPLSEIAFLLGYCDNSAFSNAFKRWFNESPQIYRERSRY